MSQNKIKKVLCETGLPVELDLYTGKSDKYITFSYANERPGEFADNMVTTKIVNLKIQLVTPKDFNYLDLKNKIWDLLEQADFTVTTVRSFLGDVIMGTEKIRQTVFDVSYAETRKMEDK